MAINEVISAPRPVDKATPVHTVPRRMLPSVAVIVAYLLIGTAAFWPVYPGISQHLFSSYADYSQSVWFLGWVPHALVHGLNPFFSNAILVPTGVNLAQNTEGPLLGLITAPFALASEPVIGANVLMVLAMPVSATAAFVVLRTWRVWGPAAALGGLIYGFSPYMVGQSLAHVELTFVPLPPIIALTVASILQHRRSPRRLGIELGLLVTAQYLISPEVLTTVAIFTVVAVACVAIRHPAHAPEMARTLSRPVGIALAVVIVLLAYPVWMLIAGPEHLTGPTRPIAKQFHNDLFNFLVPGPLQRVSLGMRSLGTRLTYGGDPVEADGYIGVPLLILTGILSWRSRRSSRTQLALVLLLGAALLSLGPHLAVDGRLTQIPLPFVLLDDLPLLKDIVPSRIGMEVGACLAAVVAFGLDDLRRAPARHRYDSARRGRSPRRGAAVFAGVTLAALVATQLPRWPQEGPNAARPAVVLPASLRRAVPAGDPVAITYPYDTYYSNQPMLWQAEDGFAFRLLGGYAYHSAPNDRPDLLPSPMTPPGLQRFLAGGLYGPSLLVSPELVATTRTTLFKYDVRLVIVDRSAGGSGPVMELFNDALGPPVLSSAQFSMWADWHGRPRHEQFLPHLSTRVLRPANGATLSGTADLDATATAWVSVAKVEFLLTDGTRHITVIGRGLLTPYGWLATWDTTSVANGTYTVQSIAYDGSGATSLSTGVTIRVKNQT